MIDSFGHNFFNGLIDKRLLSGAKNPDGTYDGAKALAAISGLSEAEIKWTFQRVKHLRDEGKSPAEVKAIVKDEVRLKPWEAPQ